MYGKRVIVQGLGNVGYYASKILQEEDGAKIIGIIEHDGALIDANGLSVESVREHVVETGGVTGYAKAKFQTNGLAALELECDILIPAALEGQISATNAANIKAPLICEAANGPITFEADQILNQRGIVVLPDAYVNAGGVTVSYFEWIRNLAHIRFGRMERRYDEVRGKHMADALESMAGSKLPEVVRDELVRGADELNLVRSGFDDTMRLANQQISKSAKSYIVTIA